MSSDALLSRADVKRLTLDLIQRRRAVGHPFILGSEWDVLSVPGCERTITITIEEFLQCQ